ncbi:glycosyltransferase family protein [Isobaculum melis]|uniref:Glycosyltransferase involved in cell wall bisynthesis n=1 Tax=Isobaculum melis TaxID=142588 RepID=A0A1H9QQB6_9LACT|nr:hypothetical protein [Isobaculum melis]SER62607.1 Glycosyltransferase involved in cell wall bisynthesis [Isobaculum melis]
MGKLIIVSQYTSDFQNEDYNRYSYIYKHLKDHYQTIFVTSTFDHYKKQPKEVQKGIVYIRENGYKKNMSLGRLFSHFFFSLRVFFFLLKNVKKEDMVLCAVPSNSLGFFNGWVKRIKKNQLIIDVHDTWPESFKPLLSPKMQKSVVVNLFFGLWKWLRSSGMKKCDLLVGESYEYVYDFKKYVKNGDLFPILLGVNMLKINQIPAAEIPREAGKLNICFAGSLGVNYNLETVVETLRTYQTELKDNINFYFLGSGEVEHLVKEVATELSFVHHIPKSDYVTYIANLKCMDVGINSFTENTNVKLSYKQSDYMACGLFLLNSLTGKLSEELIQKHLAIHYHAGSQTSLYEGLLEVVELNQNNQLDRVAAKQFATDYFAREKVYQPLFDWIAEKWRN